MDATAAISVKNISMTRKGNDILRGVDMSVSHGSIYGLLGPSGCGKTSLLQCVVGCAKADTGEVYIFGQEPGATGLEIPGTQVGYMPQEAALYMDLTIVENLTYFGRVFLMSKELVEKRIDWLITVLDLPEKSRGISTLSGGQKRRVSFAAAILHKPRLLILDEPTAGVDPLLREKVWTQLISLAAGEKTTIIITTQYIEEARKADKIGFMRKGRIMVEDCPKRLLEKHKKDTLEDVFLSLCSMKRKSTIFSAQDVRAFQDKVEKERNLRPKVPLKSKPLATAILDWITVFLAIYWKNLLQDVRNPLTMSLQYVSPISQILLFALCIGGNPFGIKMAVVNRDVSNWKLGSYFLKTIDKGMIEQLTFDNPSEAWKAAKEKKLWAVMNIPQFYSYSFINRFGANVTDKQVEQSTIRIHADMSDKIVTTLTFRSLERCFTEFWRNLLDEYDEDPNLANPYVRLMDPIYGDSQSKDHKGYRDFMLPGMILNLTFALATAMTGLTLIGERTGQTFERNSVAGVSVTQLLFAHAVARITLCLPYVALVVWLPLKLFEIHSIGNIWWSMAIVLVQNVGGMTCGMLLAAFLEETIMCMTVISAIFMKTLFLSGTIWPLEAIPLWMRWLCYLNPTMLTTEAFRNILYRGWTIVEYRVWLGFASGIAWALLFLLTGIARFKKT